MKNGTLSLVYLGGARVFQSVLGLLTLRAMTHWLSVEQFGQLGLITALSGLFGLFLVNPVGQHINRHTHAWYREGVLLRVFHQYNYYLIFISCIAFFAGFLWIYMANGSVSIEYSLLMGSALAVTLWFGTWNTTLIPMLNMLGHRSLSVTLSLLTLVMGLVSSVAFVQYHSSALVWFYGQLAGLTIGMVVAVFYIAKVIKLEKVPKFFLFITKKEIYEYCFPLAIATGLMWFLFSGYRFFIGFLYGEYSLGLLILGFGVASQYWSIIENITTQIINPKFYLRLAGEQLADKHLAFNQMLNVIIPTYILLAWVGVSSVPHILSLLTSAKFEDAAKYCMIAMVSEMARVIANALNQVAQIEKKTRMMVNPYLGAILFLLVGFIFVYKLKLSIYISVVVICVAVFIAMCIALISAYRLVKIYPDYKVWCLAFFFGVIVFLCSTLISVDTMFMHILALVFYAAIALIILNFIVFKRSAYIALALSNSSI